MTQQYYIMSKQGAEMHLMGNISRQFKPVASMAGRGADADQATTLRDDQERLTARGLQRREQ